MRETKPNRTAWINPGIWALEFSSMFSFSRFFVRDKSLIPKIRLIELDFQLNNVKFKLVLFKQANFGFSVTGKTGGRL